MATIYEKYSNCELKTPIIKKFTKKHQILELLQDVCKSKQKGISNTKIFNFLMSIPFTGKSLYQNINRSDGFKKDTIYRFLQDSTGWSQAIIKTAHSLINKTIDPLTSEKRDDCLIFDDTPIERKRSKHVELISKQFNHAKHTYTNGFRLLTMSWSDGNSFVPVTFNLLSSMNEKAIVAPDKHYATTTPEGKKMRDNAQRKTTDLVLEMLKEAKEHAIKARYVLFDSWFTMPSTVNSIKEIGFDVIGMVKKSSKIHFIVDGKSVSVKKIYANAKKRRGLAHIRYSCIVETKDSKNTTPIKVKLVYVSENKNKKNWLVLLSTDITLSDERICQLYSRRWSTEVFYKVCKSILKLQSGCQCRNFDSIISHIGIVFVQYMMLSEQQRTTKDERSLGELFYYIVDELEEISIAKAIVLVIDTLVETVQNTLKFQKEMAIELLQDFFNNLPHELVKNLKLEPNFFCET